MIQDYREINYSKTKQTDVCIVGAGAAGIAMAREFIGSKTSVLLLEAGDLNYTKESQDLYQGNTTFKYRDIEDVRPYYLQPTRLRQFGGTTSHWAGFCHPMELIRSIVQKYWQPILMVIAAVIPGM